MSQYLRTILIVLLVSSTYAYPKATQDPMHALYIDNQVSRFLENCTWFLKKRFNITIDYLNKKLTTMNNKFTQYPDWEQEQYERLQELIALLTLIDSLRDDLAALKTAKDTLESLYSLDSKAKPLFDTGTYYPRIKADGKALYDELHNRITKVGAS